MKLCTCWAVVVFLLIFSCCVGCGSDVNDPDGDRSDGDDPDGDDPDGDDPDGDDPDGDDPDGDGPDGDDPDGDEPDGDNDSDGDSDSSEETGINTPMARKVTTLIHVDEPTWLLPGVSSEKMGSILDDKGSDTPGAEIGQILDRLMTDQPNGRLVEIQSGDVDADGKDEIVVLSLYTDHENTEYRFDFPRITLIDDQDAGFAVIGTIDKTPFEVDPLNPDFDSYLAMDLALGNLDDDDALEIIVVGTYGRISINNYSGNETFQHASVIATFDDATNALAPLAFNAEVGVDMLSMHVDTGDVDHDNRDEIIVVAKGKNGYVKAWALDDHVQAYAELHLWHNLDDQVFTNTSGLPNLVCGDFDGDGLDEITFGAVAQSGYCRLQTRVFDDALQGFAYMEGKYIEDCPNRIWNRYIPLQLAAADFDGNGKDDVIIAVHDVYYDDRGWSLFYFRPDRDDSGIIETERLGKPNGEFFARTPFDMLPGGFHLAVGDFNRDRRDDVFAIYHRYNEGGIWGRDLNEDDESVIEGFDAKRWFFDDANFIVDDEWSWDLPESLPYGTAIQPLVGLGDLDGDSMVVRYTGEKWLAMSEPRIVVAMAMPPGWASIPQDNKNNTWVGYGQVREESNSESNEIAMSASVTMSMEASDPFGIVSASASTSLKEELAKTTTVTKTTSTGVKRIGNWAPDDLDNFVIYTATEYERFQYEIITHEDSDKIGTLLTIDVPVETNTYKKTVTAFNEQNGDYRDIGAETFGHTVGDPSSYPTETERDAILAAYTGWITPASSEPLYSIGETSAGGTEVFISMSEENAEAEARTLGVEVSAGFSVGGVGVETTVGLSNTSIYEIAIAESTEYVGSVGDIPSSDYMDYNYGFGMFVYNFERDDGVKYQVINWCVEE